MPKMKKSQSSIYLLVLSAFSILIGGCSALPRHEHVVGDIRTANNGMLIACMQGRQIQNGSKVEIYESTCKKKIRQRRWSAVTRVECVDQKVSDATVMSNEDIHEVTLRGEDSAQIKSGNFIKNN